MAQNDLLKRLLDAGIEFSQMTRERAEAIVQDLVSAGQVQTEQTQDFVNDLVDQTRRNTERFVDQIRAEVRNQIAQADVVTKDVVNRLQSQIDQLRTQVGGRPVAKAAATKAPAKKSTAKKAAAKKAPAKKAAAKKSTAKKSTAKKAARTAKKA